MGLKLFSMVAAVLFACSLYAGQTKASSSSFAPSLLSVEQLPQLRPIAKIGSFSSYDRTGGNDDGFSGHFSYLRKEGDALVIAEAMGPGAITRIFMAGPIPNATIEFYFDGASIPRLALPLQDVFSGKVHPFVSSLVGHGIGGYYSYVPLEFAKSIKILVHAERFHFYMVNYALYQPNVPVRTFERADTLTLPPPRERTAAPLTRQHVLQPGKTITLFERTSAGRIESLRLGPANVFAGKDRGIVLRMYWDGAQRPAVEVPAGDFFGYSFGKPAMRSLLLGTDAAWNYVRFPMPFEKAARIELVSQRSDGEPLQLQSEISISDRGKSSGEGTFHAEWRRENPAVEGKPFTYLDVTGRGHLVAAILQAQGRQAGDMGFFEGDEEALIDGKPAIHGTGSEDSFNGGWYDIPGRWYGRESQLFSGCLEYSKPLARTGGYRLFIGDAYSFNKGLRYTIEHGPEGNRVPGDYVGTTFYYLDRPDGSQVRLADLAARAVVDPEELIVLFDPIPNIIAMQGVSLIPGGEELKGQWVTYASFARNVDAMPSRSIVRKLVPADMNISDEFLDQLFPQPQLENFAHRFGSAPLIILGIVVPQSGEYAISVDAMTGPEASMLQARVKDEPVGNVLDFYTPTRARSGPQKLATLHLQEGENLLHLTLPGKNSRSQGGRVDLISVSGKRVSHAD
jgi:hypothetical protein